MLKASSGTDPANHLEALGYQRLRLLSCLRGARGVRPFEYRPDEDVFGAFREWIASIVRAHGFEAGPAPNATLALLGAGRLLSGDIAGADSIVENLPEQPHQLDHGAGHCLVQPLHALGAAVPLPPNLQDISRWVAGSDEQTALRAWLARHREELAWDEPNGVYTLRTEFERP